MWKRLYQNVLVTRRQKRKRRAGSLGNQSSSVEKAFQDWNKCAWKEAPQSPLGACFLHPASPSIKEGRSQLVIWLIWREEEGKKLKEVWGPNKEEDSCKAGVLKELQGYKATKNGTLKGLQGTVETQETTLLWTQIISSQPGRLSQAVQAFDTQWRNCREGRELRRAKRKRKARKHNS